MKRVADGFENEAERILALAIDRRVNILGGYGPHGEVIYTAHPAGCPSVVADHGANAAVCFMSNGSVSFTVTLKDGMEVNVLDGSFEAVQKREINALSANVWLAIPAGGQPRVASIINPNLNVGETVTACSLPSTDCMQIKRVSSCARNAQTAAATCDYTSFIGDTAAFAALPQAVLNGRMLAAGAGRKLSRFAIPSISATQFRWQLGAGRSAAIEQALLYVTDAKIIARFRNSAGCRRPAYADTSRAFARAAKELVKATPGAPEFAFANRLRKNIMAVAWEDGPENFRAGFIDAIHELSSNGKTPRYAQGELGYTLGSMKGRDFDGIRRRVLTTQAYCLAMLATRRDYLEAIAGGAEMIRRLLKTIDELFYDKQLGLVLFTTPIANNRRAREYIGRMGIIPAGCAENGEYHHAQLFMHRFRLRLPGQADKVWEQFTPIISSTRDESIGGPFETPTTSYGADKADPHFGKGMYFGLSGSIDWMVEVFSEIAGLELALHDDAQPDVRITPKLPAAIRETLLFRRIIHRYENGGYRRIPLVIAIKRRGAGRLLETVVKINGRRSARAEVASLAGLPQLEIEIEYRRG